MNITEIARLHGFSVGKVTGGSSIDGLVNDLVTGGEDKALTAEMGKVLNEKKILEYGGLLTGVVDFDTLTPNRFYQVGGLEEGSVGRPPMTTGVIQNGEYAVLEFFKFGTYHIQRMTQMVGSQAIVYRVMETGKPWKEWKGLSAINLYQPAKITQNLGKNVLEKSFPYMAWKNNNVTSEFMDILIPMPPQGITGMIELTLTSSFANSDATGGAVIRYHIGSNSGSVYHQQWEIVSMSEGFSKNFFVDEWKLSGDKHYLYTSVTKRSANNPLFVTIKVYNSAFTSENFLDKAELTINDHGALITPAIQSVTRTSNVKIKKDIPDFSMAIANGTKTAAIRLNANSSVDYGLDFWKDQEVFMRALNGKDVQFFDPTSGWFSIQSLKQSVSNGKKNIAQAITDVGWGTSPDATFDEMASNIGRLGTVKEARGTAYATAGYIEVRGIGFKPKAIQCKAEGVSDAKMGNAAYVGDEWINGWSDVSMYVSSWDRTSIQSDVVLYDDGFRMRVDDTNRNGSFGYYAVG